jgi:hypothetical protein
MSNTNNTNNLITFIDHIGRTIIGESAGNVDNDASFLVKNPAIIHVQPTQTGQLNVQTIPLYFREFVGDKSKENGTTWKYHYANVVFGVDVDNDPRLTDQYSKLFLAPVTPPVTEPSVVKLFDE